jgi:hypothetical protein
MLSNQRLGVTKKHKLDTFSRSHKQLIFHSPNQIPLSAPMKKPMTSGKEIQSSKINQPYSRINFVQNELGLKRKHNSQINGITLNTARNKTSFLNIRTENEELNRSY